MNIRDSQRLIRGRAAISSGVVVVAASLVLSGGLPAVATDGGGETNIADAASVIQAVAPGLLEETATTSDVDVTVSEGDGAPAILIDTSGAQPSRTAARAIGAAEALQDGAASYISPSITITPTYTSGVIGEAQGLTVLGSPDDNVTAYVQPLDAGVRILTAIADSDAAASYDYKLEIPEGSTLRDNELGQLILGPNDEVLGQLHKPWALDANGQQVSTSFSYASGVLTQHVDLSTPGVTFPILADPAWTYSAVEGITNKTVAQVSSMLRNCFNCYFPVEGAPRGFPSVDQYLPLKVRIVAGTPAMDFSCYFNYAYEETYAGQRYFGYSFRGSNTHIDGVGSGISFDFDALYPDRPLSQRGARLIVNGYVMNENPGGLPQPIYVAAARNTWSNFADNLYRG